MTEDPVMQNLRAMSAREEARLSAPVGPTVSLQPQADPLPTIARLDEAIREVLTPRVYEAMRAGQIGRVQLHDRAMSAAFLADRQDEHTHVLRVMGRELAREGVYPRASWAREGTDGDE